jgi:nicotinamide riboside transporter PnuC
VVIVESEADYIKGETEWLKNNIVSVILFAVAGVMLILIIILLLVKPSDETLDDVDKKAKAKKEKETKK